MTKKGILYLLVFLLFSCSAKHAAKTRKATPKDQNVELTEFKPDTLTGASYPDFEIDQAYRFQKFKLLFGMFDFGQEITEDMEYGLKMLVLDENNRLIFESRSQKDSYYFWPRFYRSGHQFPVVIMAETGTEYSWGNQVFLIEEKGVKAIGEIPLAVQDAEMENHMGISDVTKINLNGEQINFSFDIDSVVFDPGGMQEKIIPAYGHAYVYDGKTLKAVQRWL